MKKRRQSLQAVKFIVALAAALLFFAPFALVIFNSVKPLDQIMTDLLGLPRTVQLSNYLNAWQELNMGRVMLNTILVTGISLALILTLSCMVAYWTVRHPTKYRRLFEKLLVCSLLIPFAAVMLSLVKTMSILHLTDSLWGGIITYSGMGIAFGTFMMIGAVKSVPLELEESAKLDGANVYQTFFLIVVPLLRPTLLSLFVLDLFWVWNDYIVALTLLNTSDLMTLQLAINKLFGLYSNQWDVALPAIVISILPILVINVVMQKKIVAGVAAGAVKG